MKTKLFTILMLLAISLTAQTNEDRLKISENMTILRDNISIVADFYDDVFTCTYVYYKHLDHVPDMKKSDIMPTIAEWEQNGVINFLKHKCKAKGVAFVFIINRKIVYNFKFDIK